MSIPWWAYLPVAVLVVITVALWLHDGRKRMRKLLNEARRDGDRGGS